MCKMDSITYIHIPLKDQVQRVSRGLFLIDVLYYTSLCVDERLLLQCRTAIHLLSVVGGVLR